MKLRDIVKVNESGMVANAVNFGMMNDPDKNLRLCQGFVFNYNKHNSKSFTLGVLDAIRNSYHSKNQPNIHLFVQDYGKGKSHFALVTANYFKLLLDTPEVQGILNQVKIASGNNQGILADLESYKRRNPKHLVICISGDSGLDLRQIFLTAIRQTLENEKITDSLAQQFCQKPLAYLNSLTDTQIKQANDYLESINYQGDVNSIIDLLEQDNYKVIATVKEISKQFNIGGIPSDFDTDLSIDKILQELINKLCTGEEAKYSGILILFDELNYYLKSWATDSSAAGGASLQNITNVCENNKGKIALVCFTQIRPLKSLPNQSQDDYKKLASRLEISETTYEPLSSLELVIKGLLDHNINPDLWNKFTLTYGNTLLGDSRTAHEKRINLYQERGWNLEDFNNNLTLGCFPLHPLNTYLLCNLDFTQGRTAIQYIQKEVKEFIDNENVEKNGKLNYIPAIGLVDAFSEFSHTEFAHHYNEYQNSLSLISASATDSEIAVLKGLFLYYVSKNKFSKPESEKHNLILSELTGLSIAETQKTLDKLTQERQVIYFNTGDNTYRFYSGSNLLEILPDIINEARKQIDRLSVNLAVKHCNEKIETYCQSKIINAQDFINKNQLLNDEWFFEYKFYNIEDFKQALRGYKTLDKTTGKGIFAYVLADNIEELNNFRLEINQLLATATSRNKEYIAIAVAIPDQPVNNIQKDVDNICFSLLMLDIIRRKSTAEKQDSGTAFAQLSKQIQQKVEREIKQIIAPNNCPYYCIRLEELTTAQKQNRESIVSHLLKQLYRFVPPVANNDKMALKSSTGSTIIGYACNRLLEDDLNPNKFPNESYRTLINQVFVNSWGLFKIASQKYSVQIPTNNNIREAWEKINQLTALDNKQKKEVSINKIWEELSQPPFGYNEYTFTMLFTAWIAYHRSEVMLKGTFGLPNKKNPPSIDQRMIKDWVETNVFSKPKEFVNKWILGTNKSPVLIRSQAIICPEIPAILSYNQAQKSIDEIDNFINFGHPDQAQLEEIKPKKQQILAEIAKIDNWFKPVEETEILFNNGEEIKIEVLINLYPLLQQTLSKTIDITRLNQSNQSNKITVNPTKKQLQRQQEALEKVQEKIEELIFNLSEKSESLTTEKEFGGYQVELENIIEKLNQVSLPDHLIETLNYSLNVATRKLEEIKHQEEIKNCLDKIEIIYQSLSNNASQDDYDKAISEIEKLITNLQIIKQNERYQIIIKEIARKQNDLETNLKIWQERLTGISKDSALKLSQEISQQQNRFTQPECQQKIKQILDQLNPIILEIQNEEEAEKIKQQYDQDIMQKLRENNIKLLNTFNLCQVGITKINQLRNQLNYPERFKTEIETLINDINDKISARSKEIEDLKIKLTQVKDSQSLISIQDNLAKLKLFYQESEQDLTCQELQEEIEALRHLFQITQSAKFKTIETYQNQLQELTNWYNNLKIKSENLQTKYDKHKSNLEKEIKRIENKYKSDAKTWLNNLQQELARIEQEIEEEKLTSTAELLNIINNDQSLHINYLDDSAQKLLNIIKAECFKIQNESFENQIVTLFNQLPLERKQKLLEKLPQYLTKEEDINE